MQVTKTGYYETRDGGLAWIYPRTPFKAKGHEPIDGYVKYGDEWEFCSWFEYGRHSVGMESDLDLIRYIGKELPEEKPQPQRVELSKLWVGWIIKDGGYVRSRLFYPTKEAVKKDCDGTFEIIAITPADATGFTPGENLDV